MFGRILSIYDQMIILENNAHKVEASLIGVHVVFEEKYKIVCEISKIDADIIECVMVGEFVNGVFNSGIVHKPTNTATIRIVNKDEVIALVGSQKVDSDTDLYIGKSLIYEGFNISARIDDFFSNHFAIIGNTGSGKSCSIARIFQNLFYRREYVPVNANIVLFDVYGEYHPALEKINQTNSCRCKSLTTDITNTKDDVVKIPPYFLEVDDLALLLGITSPAQLPIIEKALKYVYLFTEDEEKVIAFKNNIIAKAILDILSSGKGPAQLRDQVVAVLSSFYTKDINLESKIIQPGYIRTLRQCMNIDNTGKINTIQLVIEYLEQFVNEELVLNKDMKPEKFTLKDLRNAFEFALISEGVLKSDKVYDINNILKVRLESIINGDYGYYFEVDEYISKEEYIKRLFTTAMGEKAQIINFNLNYVDERFAKVLTKIFSKLFFDYSIYKHKDEGFCVQIILEEAHRYVQNDNDKFLLGYNIFERITKEGRKYGVLLGLISQRPSEISETTVSQCSNFLIFKIIHPTDVEYIRQMVPNVNDEIMKKMQILQPGTCVAFGSAFKLPTIVRIPMPSPAPSSDSCNISQNWFVDRKK